MDDYVKISKQTIKRSSYIFILILCVIIFAYGVEYVICNIELFKHGIEHIFLTSLGASLFLTSFGIAETIIFTFALMFGCPFLTIIIIMVVDIAQNDDEPSTLCCAFTLLTLAFAMAYPLVCWAFYWDSVIILMCYLLQGCIFYVIIIYAGFLTSFTKIMFGKRDA